MASQKKRSPLAEFTPKTMDLETRPQDDFYQHVNGGWVRTNKIPASESRWGAFVALRYKTDKQLYTILQELEVKKSVKKGSPEQLIRDFYRSGMDMKRRNALDIKPVEPFQRMIESIQNKKDLQIVLAKLDKIGVAGIWDIGIDQDAKNSDRYALYVGQGGLGMPERDYYLKNDPESLRVRTEYRIHVAKVFKMIGRSTAESEKDTETLLRIETQLARISMKKEDLRDPDLTYNKKSLKALRTLGPNIDWNYYLAHNNLDPVRDVIVTTPEFFTGLSSMFDTVSIEDWKTYLEWHLVNGMSGALSSRFIAQSFSFYGKVLSGTKKMKPLWRRILGSVNANLGEQLGKIYVQKHFPESAKKKMNLIIDDLFTAYEARLKALDWMSSATKKKALHKLAAFNRKIGYPDKWKSYAGLVITPNDYVGNLLRASAFEHRREVKKLTKPVDRAEWHMYPQTVNAYFAPTLNDIAFPAAILQPPFFDEHGDDGINYGCIGMTIGHEITHGFDDEGSKYDAKGNLKSWWTPEDRKRFMKKAEIVRKQFDEYTVADGVRVNGKLTLGENIADLGGLSIALDAYKLQLARTGRKDIAGYTPEQRFFMGFALFERENTRPEFEKMMVLTDPHAPGPNRINGVASNIETFYNVYNVKKGDKLYREPFKRAKIW
ncbi:MAG: putative endopeptidase [Parcubacteria bacterium C7867-008]|nr:MAG: putative endopeptidase [Parcubacteria bacterium C7867-008]